ncbi:hypothetical protein [Oryzobacter terrae]|uniref:hypothetical protein n=1 Tax=Oryzobacter terrae TaxID=1620385 RepID=UPI00366BC862
MSTADVPPVHPGLPQVAGTVPGSLDDAAVAHRLHTAQRWAAGVLALATLVLVGYLALVAAAVGLAAWVLGVVRPGTGSFDLSALVVDALPALLVGWCTALATTTVLARGVSMGARVAGVTSAAVGIVLGALVLRMSGLL